MIVNLPDTTSREVAKRLVNLHETEGSVNNGRVLTLVVCAEHDEPTEGAIEAAAEAALTKAGRFTVVPVQDAFNPTNAVKRAELMATAREKLSSGKKAIDDLDNVKATADFRDALDFLQRADLSREFPAMAPYRGSVSGALNTEYARMDAEVADGDEVAFLPPVSGG